MPFLYARGLPRGVLGWFNTWAGMDHALGAFTDILSVTDISQTFCL